MKAKVKLMDVVLNFDSASDDAITFYNELTGEFYYHYEGFTEDDRDLDLEEDWVRLPTQWDANEYKMMTDFTKSIRNERKREETHYCAFGQRGVPAFQIRNNTRRY